MSATVVTGHGTYESSRAEQYHVDEFGHLHLETTYGGQVATFAAGKWSTVRLIPSRDAKGRFVKRGAK
jgi:hypothetical protein